MSNLNPLLHIDREILKVKKLLNELVGGRSTLAKKKEERTRTR